MRPWLIVYRPLKDGVEILRVRSADTADDACYNRRMTRKPDDEKNKGLEEPEAAYRQDTETYVPEDELDAFLWRNRHAIAESCRKGLEDYKRGHYYTIEEVMAELRERAKERQARKAVKE